MYIPSNMFQTDRLSRVSAFSRKSSFKRRKRKKTKEMCSSRHIFSFPQTPQQRTSIISGTYIGGISVFLLLSLIYKRNSKNKVRHSSSFQAARHAVSFICSFSLLPEIIYVPPVNPKHHALCHATQHASCISLCGASW